MIVVRCTVCNRCQLQGYAGLRAVVNGDDGVSLHLTCRACGGLAVAAGGRRG